LQRHEIIDFLESNRIPAMFSARRYQRVGTLALAMSAFGGKAAESRTSPNAQF
jgi:hypothetical protein